MSFSLLDSLFETACLWREPAHPAREHATRQTLQTHNRFTAEAIIFAANQQFDSITPDAVKRWIAGRRTTRPRDIGVIVPGNVPFAGLQDLLAVLLTGHRFIGKLSARSPYLLPAFADELRAGTHGLYIDFVSIDELLRRSAALILTGSDDSVAHLQREAADANIKDENILLRGHRYSAAVIGRQESSRDLEALAEDVLLHEGLGCRSPAIVWAPAGESPDSFLQALAYFRAVFPAHPDTRASLKMQVAYQSALGTPSGYADDASFLITRGAPDPQQPAHIRWSEYTDMNEVIEWVDAHQSRLQLVVASAGTRRQLPKLPVPLLPLGDAQRPALGWRQDGKDVVSFLCGPQLAG